MSICEYCVTAICQLFLTLVAIVCCAVRSAVRRARLHCYRCAALQGADTATTGCRYFCSQDTSTSQVYFHFTGILPIEDTRYFRFTGILTIPAFRFTGTFPTAETSKTSAPDSVTSASNRYNYYVCVTPLHTVIRLDSHIPLHIGIAAFHFA